MIRIIKVIDDVDESDLMIWREREREREQKIIHIGKKGE